MVGRGYRLVKRLEPYGSEQRARFVRFRPDLTSSTGALQTPVYVGGRESTIRPTPCAALRKSTRRDPFPPTGPARHMTVLSHASVLTGTTRCELLLVRPSDEEGTVPSSKVVKLVVAGALIGGLVMATTQSWGHYRQPSSPRSFKHDLKHLKGFMANLLDDTFLGQNETALNSLRLGGTPYHDFVEGSSRNIHNIGSINSPGAEAMLLSIAGFTNIKLRKDTAGGPFDECVATLFNSSGGTLFRNGILAEEGGGASNSNVTLSNNNNVRVGGTNTQGTGSHASFHLYSPTDDGFLSFTVSVNYASDGRCHGSIDGMYQG